MLSLLGLFDVKIVGVGGVGAIPRLIHLDNNQIKS